MTHHPQVKISKIRQHTGLTVLQIAQRLNESKANVYNNLRDHKCCKMNVALNLESATGISHQFFLYAVPTALQFLPGANDNGTK
jgi:plasmid maintenance system antidote protein VapI